MKKCSECNGKMVELKAKTPEGVEYDYFICEMCGEEIIKAEKLHAAPQKHRLMKRYNAKISKWGKGLGIKIPNELVKKYKLKDNELVTVISEKEGIKIIPA
ncbi:hypothetical protein HY636_02740 [Candidatus Woesearchaeota archaeon]|nr:hypothetical protein [Candidatus Woesearchaeota archaeon]